MLRLVTEENFRSYEDALPLARDTLDKYKKGHKRDGFGITLRPQ